MCSIFITKGYSPLEHKEMKEYVSVRGLDSTVLKFNDLIITHYRLPLQVSSEQQPVHYEENYLYFIGEYYENYSGNELIALYNQLIQELWFIDWEGTLFIYNEKNNTLKIKVDPLRKRPVFYYHNNSQKWIITNDFSFFRFAKNELLNKTSLALIQRQGFSYSSSTPLVSVKSFLSGNHIININTGNFKLSNMEIHNITFPSESFDIKKSIVREIKNAVINRIKKKSLSKQFGTYLSGGVDSTLLHRIIDDYRGEGKIPVFILENICTVEELKNINYLIRTTRAFEFHFEKYIEPSFEERIKKVIDWFYFPIDLGSVIPQIQLTEITKKYREQYSELYAILTGDGADEFFGGYKRNINYDSRYYDIFIELIYYHNLRLDQIPFKETIEIRSPFQALPLLPCVLLMDYSDRINKKLFREIGTKYFNIPKKYMSVEKHALKFLPKDKVKYQSELIKKFMGG